VQDVYGRDHFEVAYLEKIKSSLDAYLKKVRNATDKGDDQQKLSQLLNNKKLFSAVWLLPSG
jgi:hypothetical protein